MTFILTPLAGIAAGFIGDGSGVTWELDSKRGQSAYMSSYMLGINMICWTYFDQTQRIVGT